MHSIPKACIDTQLYIHTIIHTHRYIAHTLLNICIYIYT